MFLREFRNYLRSRPWHRRLMTLTLAMLVGMGAAVACYPYYRQLQRDRALLASLAQTNPIERTNLVVKAVHAAKGNPVTIQRLRDALDTHNDYQFSAIVRVLRGLGEFDEPHQPTERLDRLLVVNYELTTTAETRMRFFMPILLTDRDNPYIRRALKSSLKDLSPVIRAMAATLAAKLGDDDALRTLLKDSDPKVAARAALDAGIAGRGGLRAELVKMVDHSDVEVASAAAFAAAELQAPMTLPSFQAAIDAGKHGYAERLLWVLSQAVTSMKGQPHGETQRLRDEVLELGTKGNFLSPAGLMAAARTKSLIAPDAVRRVLDAAGKGDPNVTIAQTIAAIDAAEVLQLPVRAELYKLCEAVWNDGDDFQLLLIHAARALGRQAAMPQGDRGDTPTRHECERLLQSLARFTIEVPASAPASGPATASAPATTMAATATGQRPAATSPAPAEMVEVLGTPIPSAAAAAALWDLGAPFAEEFAREACVDENSVVGDYVVWEMAAGPRRAAAFEVALKMLPPLTAKERVYFANERAAGAMLLALSAADADQRRKAMDCVTPRLTGNEMDFVARGTYDCAALILGQNQRQDAVRMLLETGFPQRRCLTALVAAGDKQALDWLLWNPGVGPEQIAATLLLRGVQDVTDAWVQTLPHVDASAEYDLRMWQVQILRDSYVIHRATLKVGKP